MRAYTRGELREFGLLYRQTAADLSILREDRASGHFARYLNQLLGRVHNIIYSGHKSRALDVVRFYRCDYPVIFRRTFRYTLAALLLFAGSALLGSLLTLSRPEFMRQFLGPAMVETIERRQMWTHSIVAIKPLASSAILTNNLSVAFVTCALGITGGLGTIYMLVFNGLLIGVIGTACWLSGMSLGLWSFVAPHGVLELPAIFIAGGAGLRLAHGLLFPGSWSRRDSLAMAGADAVRLLVGVIPLLVVAGVVEGFFSPTDVPAGLKLGVAALGGVSLVAYLFFSGAPRTTEDSFL